MGYRNRSPPRVEKRVTGLLGKVGFRVALPGLDVAYQQQLVALTHVRRAAAGVATSRKRPELQIGELERQAGERGNPGQQTREVTGQLADLNSRVRIARTGLN